MSYIDSNLLAGEHVVFRTRLHWFMYVWPIVFLLVTMFPVGWLAGHGTWSNWAWLPVALSLPVMLAAVIKRQSSDFAVTNKRVMMKVGVFNTRSIELLLSKVEAIAVNQSLLGRMFSFGDIVVTGSGGTNERFSHIQAPLEFRRAVQAVTDSHGNSDAAQ